MKNLREFVKTAAGSGPTAVTFSASHISNIKPLERSAPVRISAVGQ